MICTDVDLDLWLRTNDQFARERLVERYCYLCRRARKFARRKDDWADLEQVAAVGLLKAVDRYRGESGTPFEAYAWIIIQGELLHYVRDHERIVRAPRRLRELERRWRERRDYLTVCLGREPSDAEVAQHLSLDRETARELHEYRERARIASLDSLAPRDAARFAYNIQDCDDRLALDSAIAGLSPVEQFIVVATINDDSVLEIAAKLGYSRRHISRLRQTALSKIKPRYVRQAV